MAPNKVKIDWVYKFTVESPLRHPKGFTVYKFTSLVYPRATPEAGTKLVIWKRFNDFKLLNQLIKKTCKLLNLLPPPTLTKASYFNRFDETVIAERRKSCQNLVDFIAENRLLFLSEHFVSFCKKGYRPVAETMGQMESANCERSPLHVEGLNHWRWTDGTRWTSESSDDESGPGSTASTPSSTSATSPSHNNNNMAQSKIVCFNNNADNHQLQQTDSLEVVDIAGYEDKVLPREPGAYSEVVCHSEHPVSAKEIWVTVPPAVDYKSTATLNTTPSTNERLSAYSVVGVMGGLLIVTHCSRPEVRLALKVLRKNCWPVTGLPSAGDPIPVPNMVRLIDWIETEDAVFVIMELITRGLLIDHMKRMQSGTDTPKSRLITPRASHGHNQPSKNYAPDSDLHGNPPLKTSCQNSPTQSIDNTHKIITTESKNGSSLSLKLAESSKESNTKESSEITSQIQNPSLFKDMSNRTMDKSCARSGDPNAEVDELVEQAQRLLASVSRTLEKSAAQQEELSTVLNVKMRKPRSKSVLSRPRLERRFSSGDAAGVRPRTAHVSLERSARRTPVRVPESSVKEWAASLVVALETLHHRGIIWKDLHFGNLLYDLRGVVLTHHHRWKDVEQRLSSAAVKGMFVAPEVFGVFPVTAAADWWSFGVILYQLLTGLPLSEAHPAGITSHTQLELPEDISVEGRSLVRGMVVVEPGERLGSGVYEAEEIKCHPFFNGIDWDDDAYA